MKKSFKKILAETSDERKWDYYNSDKSFIEFPIVSEENSKEFIHTFFKLSGKGEHKLKEQINKLGSRAVHVVSAFLLGHYLYQKTILKEKIDNEIACLKKDLGLTSKVDFSFMWFLVCLFHDIGFNMEEKQFKYKSYEELANGEDMPEISGIPKFYNTIYKNYFEYRINEHCKNDHGIMVGHIMYKELCRIREFFEVHEKSTNLNWEKDLEKIYAFCSWNVLAHNIWFCGKGKKSNEKTYVKYGLENLLHNRNEYKIDIKEHPFFFVFCLVDTIEPYKRFLDLESLEKVFLEIKNDKIIISTDVLCSCGKKVIEQAKNLNDWLVKARKVNNENAIQISLTHNRL